MCAPLHQVCGFQSPGRDTAQGMERLDRFDRLVSKSGCTLLHLEHTAHGQVVGLVVVAMRICLVPESVERCSFSFGRWRAPSSGRNMSPAVL
jgi:hypothetical protein